MLRRLDGKIFYEKRWGGKKEEVVKTAQKNARNRQHGTYSREDDEKNRN